MFPLFLSLFTLRGGTHRGCVVEINVIEITRTHSYLLRDSEAHYIYRVRDVCGKFYCGAAFLYNAFMTFTLSTYDQIVIKFAMNPAGPRRLTYNVYIYSTLEIK